VVVPAQPELPAPGPTLLLTPLTVPQETLGLLSLALVDPVEAVSPATLCLLYLICKQFALTLRNMRLYEGLLAQNRELQIAQYDLHQKIVQLEQTREHLSTSLWELELKTRELEALKSELEERVRQRTQELEEANLALERMARTDGLTGLTNRGTFEDLLEMENRRVQRYHRTASVVMIDVNGLKQVNDCQGHIAGDRLIQAAAEVLRETCRRSDVVARYGGDEFVLLLPETAAPQVPKLIARLDQSIADWNAAQSDPGFTLSLSIGYADADECGDLHAALKQADARMYEEKRRRYAALSR
jgi:diguanylate cyclase (GGDEF)-like protein